VTAQEIDRPLHPRHGTHDPTTGSPARRPGSIRRTTTVDMVRVDDLLGPLTLRGTGRDIVTDRAGQVVESDAATLLAHVAFLEGRALTDIETDPELPELSALLGVSVSSGFRGRLDEATPGLRERGSVLYQLLDDLPVATLVSGYVLGAAGVVRPGHFAKHRPTADLCAGWRTGGTIMIDIERIGTAPVVTGPVAPQLGDPDDPVGWHAVEPLPIWAMRRARRLDVWIEPSGTIVLDSLFRDSCVGADGVETAIHEYTVAGTVDPETMSFLEIAATPHALPWVECPVAAESADRLVGHPVSDLRSFIRTDFTGISTCTHLNDQLRTLADVTTLAERVGAV
jgi:hypothetical protein